MRDNRKDKSYYDAYLDYQYSRIEKKRAKLEEYTGDKKQKVLLSLTGFEIDLLKAEFSSGASKGALKMLLREAINIVRDNRHMTYDHLLVLLSLSIMLGSQSDARKLFSNNENIIKTDRLLAYLSSYIETGKAVWDYNTPIREEYALMDDVVESADKNAAMSKYLDRWYANHSEYAWYDSHLRDTDTYCGYWSFESAAAAVILGLDDETFKRSEYYPTL